MAPPPAAASARTIDDVVHRLDEVISRSVREGSRMGLFACLYRSVTVRVRDAIAAGQFEDGPRMERFDVVFANRYLDALAAYRRGDQPGRSWMAAFEGARSARLLIIQQLLLGMNAHINLDLGAAAAHSAPGAALPGLRRDFFEITRILGEMLEDVQSRISRVSPWMGVVDAIGCRNDEHVFFFALSRARDAAWAVAKRLAATPPERVPGELERVDRVTALLAGKSRNPGIHLLPPLLVVRAREPNDVAEVMAALT